MHRLWRQWLPADTWCGLQPGYKAIAGDRFRRCMFSLPSRSISLLLTTLLSHELAPALQCCARQAAVKVRGSKHACGALPQRELSNGVPGCEAACEAAVQCAQRNAGFDHLQTYQLFKRVAKQLQEHAGEMRM